MVIGGHEKMKQDKQENNDDKRFVEQYTLGPPDDYFYVSEELATTLSGNADKVFLIPTYRDGYDHFV